MQHRSPQPSFGEIQLGASMVGRLTSFKAGIIYLFSGAFHVGESMSNHFEGINQPPITQPLNLVHGSLMPN